MKQSTIIIWNEFTIANIVPMMPFKINDIKKLPITSVYATFLASLAAASTLSVTLPSLSCFRSLFLKVWSGLKIVI
jgi:hypothetical protein